MSSELDIVVIPFTAADATFTLYNVTSEYFESDIIYDLETPSTRDYTH